jgi:bacillithiol system protein YtxJ
MSKKKLVQIEDFNEVKDNSSFFIMKHSSTCPISDSAFEEWNSFIEDYPNEKYTYLVVQEARPLSNHIAEHYGVKHESPQVLYIKDGKVIWADSHWNITYSKLQEVFQQHLTK